jgi:hypothetical protein
MTTNQISYFEAKEQQRHNLAMEYETHRTNVANEGIKTQQNMITDSHYTRMDAETLRHNLATEQQAREQLNLGYAQLDLGNRQLAETTRHNYASESLQLSSLSEEKRHNVASEKLGVINANENIRHNEELERMQDEINGSNIVANYAKASQLNADKALRQAQTSEVKTKQKLEQEQLSYYKELTSSQIFKNYTSGVDSVARTIMSTMAYSY